MMAQEADVYALGAVMYEMLAGDPPFTGSTAQAIVAKASRDTPQPLRVSRPSVPIQVDSAISKALAKLPADRLGTAGELVRALDAAVSVATPSPIVEPVLGVARPPAARRLALGAGLAALGLGVGFGIAVWTRPDSPAPARRMRFTLELMPGIHPESPYNRFALSPNGSAMVYVGGRGKEQRLYLRFFDRLESNPLPGTDGALTPFFLRTDSG